jgi:hypothetical protein
VKVTFYLGEERTSLCLKFSSLRPLVLLAGVLQILKRKVKSSGLKQRQRNLFLFLINNNRIIWKLNLVDPTKGVDFYQFESGGLHEKHAVAT